MRLVIAFGGNALIREHERGTWTEQSAHALVAARAIARVARSHEVVLTHGNGPQVGALALQQQLGEAEAEATRARGLAEGDATKAKGLAEAEAIGARAEALARNQEAVIAQQIAEQLPQIVGEASKAFANIGSMTVLNGAEGVGQMFSQVLGMGAAAIPMLRGLLDGRDGSAARGAAAAPAPEEARQAAS
jgi:carbamate kinase